MEKLFALGFDLLWILTALWLLHFAYVRKNPLLSLLYAGFFLLWIFVRLFLLHPNLKGSSMQILLAGFIIASTLFYWTLFKNRGFNIKEHSQ
jgi:hypothetical protein